MNRLLLSCAWILCLTVSGFSVASANILRELNDNTRGLIGAWDFSPFYHLERSARATPWDSPVPEVAYPLFPLPDPSIPNLYGNEATDQKIRLLDPDEFPREAFTVETWFNLHVNQRISAMVGVFQDDATPPPSWSLGFSERRAFFTLQTESGARQTTLHLDNIERNYSWNRWWYHIVGVYDGTSAKLYINGQLLEETTEARGALVYPGGSHLSAYAYLENEPYMRLGEYLRNLYVYDRALSEDEVNSRFEAHVERTMDGRLFDDRFHFTAPPILQNQKPNSISILWETDRPSSGTLHYGSSVEEMVPIESEDYGRLHVVTINELDSYSGYFYRVTAESEDGDALDSGIKTFQTAVEGNTPFSFAMISDTETRAHITERVANLVWEERPNFMMNLGDITDGGQERARFEWTYEYLAPIATIASRIPMFHVIGNGESDRVWYSHYSHLPEPEHYYSFTYGNAEFFNLNSNIDMGPESEQYIWLEEKLRNSTATWKFVTHHHPPFRYVPMITTMNKIEGDWSNLRMRAPVDLYEKYDVDICWFGHIHFYNRSWPVQGADIVKEDDGVLYVQLGGGGGNLSTTYPFSTLYTRKYFSSHNYCIVDISGDLFEAQVFDIEGNLRDSFFLKKE